MGLPDNRKKLVLVTTVPDTFSAILSGQARWLNEFFQVTLITSDLPRCIALSETEGVPVICVDMQRRPAPLQDARSIHSMYRQLARLKPDIVHSFTPKAGLVTMTAAWIARVPTRIHTFTGLLFPTASGASKTLLKSIDKTTCWFATHVVPEGQGVRKDLLAAKITGKPLQVIGHGNIAGVDTSYFDPADEGVSARSSALRDQLGLKPDDVVFVYLGRLNRDKGLHELAEAFDPLPPYTKLLLVGGEDSTAPVHPATLERLRANARVQFIPFQTDVRPILLLADIVCLPSYREGFPNLLLQAGAMGKPAIASDINGCNEIIVPDKNGWLVPSRDSRALYKAMEASIRDRSQLVAMGHFARQHVIEKFERQQYLRCLLEYYRAISG